MRRLCVVVGLLACASSARADWQPEPPPVPPETESAERVHAHSAAPSGAPSPQLLAANEPVRTSDGQPAAGSQSGAAAAPTTSAASEARGRRDADALRAFPPAPPPVVPGGSPAKPTTALVSFAPAPAPAPDQAHAAPALAADQAHAAALTPAITEPSPAPEPAAASGSEAIAPTERAPEVWSAAALFGIAATFDNTVAGVNPLGFGFGVRGDYRILPEWALGARILYFVGGSVELPINEVAMQSWLIAAEAAYALELDPISIEPGVAMGLYVRETNYRGFASFTDEPSLSLPDSTRLFFYFAPGVNVSVPLAVVTPALAPLSLGADVRLDLAFGTHVTSNIQLLLQAGLRF